MDGFVERLSRPVDQWICKQLRVQELSIDTRLYIEDELRDYCIVGTPDDIAEDHKGLFLDAVKRQIARERVAGMSRRESNQCGFDGQGVSRPNQRSPRTEEAFDAPIDLLNEDEKECARAITAYHVAVLTNHPAIVEIGYPFRSSSLRVTNVLYRKDRSLT